MRFSLYALCIALFGTRFGVPVGGTEISLVGPAVLGLAALAFSRGTLLFDRTRFALYLLLCSLTVVSSAIVTIEPDRFGEPISWTSLAQFLVLTSLLVVRFTEPVDEIVFFSKINMVIAVIAICGILQFFAQFAGLGSFSFRGTIPDSFLFELGYNIKIAIGSTNYFKSNGFFLLEPSMFSQFMALGLCIEIVGPRRLPYVVLLLGGLIVSSAGTGWIILGAFIITVGVGMKSRGVLLAIATVSMLAAGLTALAFIAPDIFDSFVGRIGEFSAPGSSAHARFVAPVWAVQDVISRAPWALWSGIGAGNGERLVILTYDQSMDTPIKILIEFGLPAMLTYIALLSSGRKTRIQVILLIPGLVMVLLTGSYAQVPPMLYPVAIIICIATLTSSGKSVAALNHQGSRETAMAKRQNV